MSTPNPNNPPQYSPTARGFLDGFAAAQYPSELKSSEHVPKIAKAELNGYIDANEREVALRALEYCRDHMKPNSGLAQPASPAPWSPSGMIGNSAPREPDFRERQLPRGDRD